MKFIKLITISICLASSYVCADVKENIQVFYNDSNPVILDIELPSHIGFESHNLDAKDKSIKKLNSIMRSRVGNNIAPSEVKNAYRQAFSEFMNSAEWPSFYNEIGKGGAAISSAMKARIIKIPAIVFNGNEVVYGVTSLKEAVEIYAGSRK